jgi:hypothetical protein
MNADNADSLGRGSRPARTMPVKLRRKVKTRRNSMCEADLIYSRSVEHRGRIERLIAAYAPEVEKLRHGQ